MNKNKKKQQFVNFFSLFHFISLENITIFYCERSLKIIIVRFYAFVSHFIIPTQLIDYFS